MLVLTRKTGQRFTIGDNIVITVTETERGKCRIGILAPKTLAVTREELLATEEMELILANATVGSKS